MFGSDRQRIEEIIYNAEINSANVGTSVMELLSEYASELKHEKPQIAAKLVGLTKELRAGVKRWDAYKPYVDESVLVLLNIAEASSIPSDKIIRDYAPVRRITAAHEKTIRRNMLGPTGGAAFITALLSYSVSQFKKPIDSGMIVLPDNILFMMDYYTLINFTVVFLISGVIIAFPRKIPMLKGIFDKLDSLLALSIIRTMILVGYSSDDLIPVIKKQFKIDHKVEGQGIVGLVELLRFKKYITAEEAAEIKITMRNSDPIRPMAQYIKEREGDGEVYTKEAGKAVSTMAMLMTAVPVLMLVSILVAFLFASVEMSQGAGA